MSKTIEQYLLDGDYSALESAFSGTTYENTLISEILDRPDTPQSILDEALACASFFGAEPVAKNLLERGIKPEDGNRTGSDAFHWAVDRGNLQVVKLLLAHGAPMETVNRFGGTVLGAAVWSAINSKRPDHFAIIRELLEAGANPNVGCPDSAPEIKKLLTQYR